MQQHTNYLVMSNAYTIYKHNLYLEMLVTSRKLHEGLRRFKGLKRSNCRNVL